MRQPEPLFTCCTYLAPETTRAIAAAGVLPTALRRGLCQSVERFVVRTGSRKGRWDRRMLQMT